MSSEGLIVNPQLSLGDGGYLSQTRARDWTIASAEQSLIEYCDFTKCDLRSVKGLVLHCRLIDCQLPEPFTSPTCYVVPQ